MQLKQRAIAKAVNRATVDPSEQRPTHPKTESLKYDLFRSPVALSPFIAYRVTTKRNLDATLTSAEYGWATATL